MARISHLLLPLGLLSLTLGLACGDKDNDDTGTGDGGAADGGTDDGGSAGDGGSDLDTDADEDGFTVAEGDCNDTDPAVNPDADEVCNGVDDDCDTVIDEGASDVDEDGIKDCLDVEECDGIDNDGDGDIDEDFGDSDEDGLVDCLDAEECDGLDNDGDGLADEDFDADGDGSSLCDEVPDCDDTDADRTPGRTEIPGDGVDNDCDELIDEGGWVYGDIVIVEMMVNPYDVSDPNGEWIELLNDSGRTVYLNGLTLKSSGDGDHQIVSDEPIELADGEVALLALQSSPSVNGGVHPDYDYADIALTNETDDLSVYAGGTMLDMVAWGGETGLYPEEGASLTLDVIYFSATENDDASSWCSASYPWAFGSDSGTPGDSGNYCSTIDHDGDGYYVDTGDCDDGDASVYPGASDTWYDGIDGDCDGSSDYDADYDGYDSDLYGGEDCDDTNRGVNPDQEEVCDDSSTDEDCNGLVNSDDPGVTGGIPYYPDSDGDGFGLLTGETEGCDPIPGYADEYGDCDDTDDTVYPGAPDTWYDGVDSDCEEDDDFDADGDGFRAEGYFGGDDCDDTRDDVNPDGREVCDDESADEDCDGLINSEDDDVRDFILYYLDNDDDGYGTYDDVVEACDPVDGYADEGGDCDDDDPSVNPGATDDWYDGDDTDCDGWSDYDADRDGFDHEDYGGIDCNDEDDTVWPYAWEDDTDGVDNDCDGYVDTLDPDEPTRLSLSDDDYESVSFSDFRFPFCGSDRSSMYVTSNGLLTFTSYTTGYTESSSSYRSLTYPTIAHLWDDLNPGSGGTYYVLEHDGAYAVYMRGVYEYSTTSPQTLTTVLLDSGEYFTYYENISISDGLAGWSCGSPSDYEEVDLTAAMDEIHDGAFGFGDGTEDAIFQVWTSGNDLDGEVIRMCATAGEDSDGDGYTDECGDPDDTNPRVTP